MMPKESTTTNHNPPPASGCVVIAKRPFDLSERVRERLDATGAQMAAYIDMTYRTYRRRAKTGTLEDAESAKVEMLDALLNLGTRVLGGDEEARRWRASPILSLGSEPPIELPDSVKGYERVKNKLLHIEYETF